MHHLVLADDSNTTQTLVRLSLVQEPGIKVHTFDDANSALEHVQSQPTDILLAKLSLPQLDGYELCRRVKEDRTTSRVRVLLLGRAHEAFDEDRAQQVGCDGYLIKPFETSELVARIQTLLTSTESEPKETATATDDPTPAPESGRAAEGLSNLPQTSEPTVPLLTLNPSQCRPDCNLLARDVRKARRQQTPPTSPAAGSASEPKIEVEGLIQDVLDRLPQELGRILPGIIQDILSSSSRDRTNRGELHPSQDG